MVPTFINTTETEYYLTINTVNMVFRLIMDVTIFISNNITLLPGLVKFVFYVCAVTDDGCFNHLSITLKDHERPSLEPVFGLSFLGYCRNMEVQHGSLRGRGPSPYVDIKGSF